MSRIITTRVTSSGGHRTLSDRKIPDDCLSFNIELSEPPLAPWSVRVSSTRTASSACSSRSTSRTSS